jgi:hypothetical protein
MLLSVFYFVIKSLDVDKNNSDTHLMIKKLVFLILILICTNKTCSDFHNSFAQIFSPQHLDERSHHIVEPFGDSFGVFHLPFQEPLQNLLKSLRGAVLVQIVLKPFHDELLHQHVPLNDGNCNDTL